MANFAGVQLHGTMRRMACITMMMAAIVTGLCACTEKTEITTDMNGSGATDNDNFQIRMTKSVPAQYFSEATVCVFLPNIHASAFLGGECKIVRCKIVRKKRRCGYCSAFFVSLFAGQRLSRVQLETCRYTGICLCPSHGSLRCAAWCKRSSRLRQGMRL